MFFGGLASVSSADVQRGRLYNGSALVFVGRVRHRLKSTPLMRKSPLGFVKVKPSDLSRWCSSGEPQAPFYESCRSFCIFPERMSQNNPRLPDPFEGGEPRREHRLLMEFGAMRIFMRRTRSTKTLLSSIRFIAPKSQMVRP